MKSAASGTFTQVSSGGGHNCALRDDGAIECWGDDFYGQGAPLRTAAGGTYVQLTTGLNHTCALRDDSRVECWGSITFGEATVPDSLAGASFSEVRAGFYNTCALGIDGTTRCWGPNLNNSAPAARAALSGSFLEVRPGWAHTCALRSDGAAECWGRNDSNQAPATRSAQSPPSTAHLYPTATFAAAPSPVQAGSPFTLSLSNAQVPGWSGFVSFTYAFDCGDGVGYRGFAKRNSVSCPTTAAGTRTVKGKLSDQSGDITEYTATLVIGGVTAPTLSIDANANLAKSGQTTVTGIASCSATTQLMVNVTLTQVQTKGRTTTTVTGSGSANVTCSGSTAWSAVVIASSPAGSKFASGTASATANAAGVSATSAVQLK